MNIEEKCRRRIVELNHPECESYEEAINKERSFPYKEHLCSACGGRFKYEAPVVNPTLICEKCEKVKDFKDVLVNSVMYKPFPCTIGRVIQALKSLCGSVDRWFLQYNSFDVCGRSVRFVNDENEKIYWTLTKENGQECELSDQTPETKEKLYNIIK